MKERVAVELPEELRRVVAEIIAPLLEADGGGLEVLSYEGTESALELRLTGAFRGDPGAPYVRDAIVKPALEKAAGKKLALTWRP